MFSDELTVPVLFCIFNRPDTTQSVFEAIKKVKPKKLFVSADGPRIGSKSDEEMCKLTRDIIKQVDWDCELHTNFSEVNLGCDRAIPTAVNWFFGHVESGIILEDDCLANRSFFQFCQELLDYYKDDSRIMHISGNNFQDGINRGNGSYYFSKEPLIWGWATWKRAWEQFQPELTSLSTFDKQKQIKNLYNDLVINFYRIYHFKKTFAKKRPAGWDFKWVYSLYTQNGLCITPNVNLVENIGFGKNSFHSKNAKDRYAGMRTYEMDKIVHPDFILPDNQADIYTLKNHLRYSIRGIIEKIIEKSLEKLENALDFSVNT